MSLNSKLPYPSPIRAWTMVVILTLAYVLSFVDRYILSLLAEPIKADLNLSDTQMGLLLGPAFAIFYALVGLPLGYLADRKRRTWIVAIGIALWSLATSLSGIARSFFQLFIARMAVGVGEAALSPCTMSLIADSFAQEKRGKPIALYSTAISLGAGIALLAGGAVIGWAMTADPISIPSFGELKPWQLTMIIVGLPGLILAPLLLLLPEPKRRNENIAPGTSQPTYADTFKYILARRNFFLCFISVFCLMTIIGYSTSWGAPMFTRTWGWSIVQYSQWAGIMFIVVGPVTVNFAGWLSDFLYKKGINDAPMLIAMAGVPIMSVSGFIWPLMPTPELAIFVLGITMAGVALSSATGATALLNILPANMRGQAMAIYYVCISFFGLGFGPTTIGLLSDFVFGEAQLRYSIAMLSIIYGIPVLILMPWTRKSYKAELQKVRELQLTAQSDQTTSEGTS
ncbi:MFS transporter [Hirschia litorea]|uniref:MFS transporter n=1 Tax=Hirschia litorea TaxID=1199156 RepID=A0ABW2INZ9_9PROT